MPKYLKKNAFSQLSNSNSRDYNKVFKSSCQLKFINSVVQQAVENLTIQSFPSASQSSLQLNTVVVRRSALVHHTVMFLCSRHTPTIISHSTLRQVLIYFKIRTTVYISQDCKAMEKLKWLNRKTIYRAGSLRR